MPEEIIDNEGTENEAQPEQQEQQTFTQEQVNELVGKARKAARSKFAEENEALKSEISAAKGDIEAIRAENEALKAEKQRAEWKRQAANEHGVPSSLVRGESLEEMQEHAKALSAALITARGSRYTPVAETGGAKAPAITADYIRGIKDNDERLKMRAAHPELFK